MDHQFRDAHFMSATEKLRTLRAWVRFLKNGLKFEHFTKALYNHLIQHCSFIAHFNRAGFYSHYFETGDATARFLSQFDSRGECLSIEYGYCGFWLSGDYEDLNRAMIAEATEFIPPLIDAAIQRQKTADIAVARALLTRHGVPLEAAQALTSDVGRAGVMEPSQISLPYSD